MAILPDNVVIIIAASTDVEEDEDDEDYSGYFCLKLEPTVCSCGHISEYFEPTDFHVILLWEEADDNVLLKTAKAAVDMGVDAHIIEYQPEFGKAIEFDKALSIGMLP